MHNEKARGDGGGEVVAVEREVFTYTRIHTQSAYHGMASRMPVAVFLYLVLH